LGLKLCITKPIFIRALKKSTFIGYTNVDVGVGGLVDAVEHLLYK
jgi:hypothetical protein